MIRACWLVFSLALLTARLGAAGIDARGNQFFWFTNFSTFTKSGSAEAQETVLTSPEMEAQIRWDQLVASWDVDLQGTGALKVEVRAIYANHQTKYFVMGKWSANPELHPRESVSGQKDADGNVEQDTLVLAKPAKRFQIRLTLTGTNDKLVRLKFVGATVSDTKLALAPLPPNRAAWGITLPVIERSQMAYPNGNVLCSPTTVSMIMTYWADKLKRPELDHDVPDIVKAIYDEKHKGTGNWPFNTAYAGSYSGMRAYVARLSDVSELEDWIVSGNPVGVSVCYDRLRGKGRGPNGHLVVCVGFTQEGDPVINDPGTSKHVRKVFSRANLIDAWANSHNAVYLIYPEEGAIPADRFGHWASSVSQQRMASR